MELWSPGTTTRFLSPAYLAALQPRNTQVHHTLKAQVHHTPKAQVHHTLKAQVHHTLKAQVPHTVNPDARPRHQNQGHFAKMHGRLCAGYVHFATVVHADEVIVLPVTEQSRHEGSGQQEAEAKGA